MTEKKILVDALAIPPAEVAPQIYANGFRIAAGHSDVILILERNGTDINTLNISFTIAKSLAQGLGDVVQELEAKTGMNIKTSREISLSLGGGD